LRRPAARGSGGGPAVGHPLRSIRPAGGPPGRALRERAGGVAPHRDADRARGRPAAAHRRVPVVPRDRDRGPHHRQHAGHAALDGPRDVLPRESARRRRRRADLRRDRGRRGDRHRVPLALARVRRALRDRAGGRGYGWSADTSSVIAWLSGASTPRRRPSRYTAPLIASTSVARFASTSWSIELRFAPVSRAISRHQLTASSSDIATPVAVATRATSRARVSAM